MKREHDGFSVWISQMPNAMGTNFGQPSAQEMSQLLNANNQGLAGRLPNGTQQTRRCAWWRRRNACTTAHASGPLLIL